jgi:hypothetical protein
VLPGGALIGLVLVALTLVGCGGDGAGGFPLLEGTWQGTWQEGAVPSGAQAMTLDAPAMGPQDHSSTGSIRVTITVAPDGTVSGMATMTPDVCAAGAAEVAMQVDVEITGTQTGDQFSFSYDSALASPGGPVTWSSNNVGNPMQGSYDGSTCKPPTSASWVGGFSLSKES